MSIVDFLIWLIKFEHKLLKIIEKDIHYSQMQISLQAWWLHSFLARIRKLIQKSVLVLAAKIALVPQSFHRLELHKAKENMTKTRQQQKQKD
jgi:hypothetical protein